MGKDKDAKPSLMLVDGTAEYLLVPVSGIGAVPAEEAYLVRILPGDSLGVVRRLVGGNGWEALFLQRSIGTVGTLIAAAELLIDLDRRNAAR